MNNHILQCIEEVLLRSTLIYIYIYVVNFVVVEKDLSTLGERKATTNNNNNNKQQQQQQQIQHKNQCDFLVHALCLQSEWFVRGLPSRLRV